MSSNRLIPFCLFSAVVSAGEARGFVGFLPHYVFLFSRSTFFNESRGTNHWSRRLFRIQHFRCASVPVAYCLLPLCFLPLCLFPLPLHLLTYSPIFPTHRSLLSTQHLFFD